MKKLPFLVLVLALLSGCAMNPKPVVGSANQFDSDTYLTLVTTDSLIQSTKADLANASFPASIVSRVKSALNTLIAAYDATDAAYITYHNAALAGTATPAQQTAVSNSMISVQAATSNLISAKAGK